MCSWITYVVMHKESLPGKRVSWQALMFSLRGFFKVGAAAGAMKEPSEAMLLRP